ncbi:MAG: hypothetical protein FWH55_09715 [Oscillospiraceae bacterium]|nr:hypothetical protein [Oscillospiraceae bacterium]
MSTLISDMFSAWRQECDDRFYALKSNEEELNRLFIEIYGLQDELMPEVEEKNVTVRRADMRREIRSLMSYAVGCMFGRYTIYEDGLFFAGGKWDYNEKIDLIKESAKKKGADSLNHSELYMPWRELYLPCREGILPICDNGCFEDDVVSRLVDFIRKVYGVDTLEENLRFIAGALAPFRGQGGEGRGTVRQGGAEQDAAERSNAERGTVQLDGAGQGGAEQDATEHNGTEHNGAEQGGAERGIRERSASEHNGAEQGRLRQGAVERGIRERSAAEHNGAEQDTAEQGGAEEGGAEQNGAEQNGAEQNGAEHNGAEQDTAEQGGAEQDGATRGAARPRELSKPRDVIRNYFLNFFFRDHCKNYRKRPIYWLFDSGKKNAFKALTYMHRYTSDLLTTLQTDYVHKQQQRYREQLAIVEQAIDTVIGASERVKLIKQYRKIAEQLIEISAFEERVNRLADRRIEIDLNDGVKQNYELFSDVLAKI